MGLLTPLAPEICYICRQLIRCRVNRATTRSQENTLIMPIMQEPALQILPEMGIQHFRAAGTKKEVMDLRARAAAMCNTLLDLSEMGFTVHPEPTEEDLDVAEALVTSYASDPGATSKELSDARAATLTPASLLLVNDVLERFGHLVVRDATRIRHYVTNRLLVESDHADPKIRMRALELLGKTSDVGLFTEKKHITIEDRTDGELRGRLEDKLKRLDNMLAVDAEYTELSDNNKSVNK